MAQLFDAAMIGGRGANFGDLHHLCPIDIKFRSKIAAVPKMEQGHVQADMSGVQATVLGNLAKDPVQMGNVIDILQTFLKCGVDLVTLQDFGDFTMIVVEHATNPGIGQCSVDAKVLQGPR